MTESSPAGGVLLDKQEIEQRSAQDALRSLEKAVNRERKHRDDRGRRPVSLRGVRALKPSERTPLQRKALRTVEKEARRSNRAPKKRTRSS